MRFSAWERFISDLALVVMLTYFVFHSVRYREYYRPMMKLTQGQDLEKRGAITNPSSNFSTADSAIYHYTVGLLIFQRHGRLHKPQSHKGSMSQARQHIQLNNPDALVLSSTWRWRTVPIIPSPSGDSIASATTAMSLVEGIHVRIPINFGDFPVAPLQANLVHILQIKISFSYKTQKKKVVGAARGSFSLNLSLNKGRWK